MEKLPTVYIMTNRRNGALYVGVTSNLIKRVWQHREGVFDGFTKRHSLKSLAWFERMPTMVAAIAREKEIKKWNRQWKVRLIERFNPEWDNLYSSLFY